MVIIKFNLKEYEHGKNQKWIRWSNELNQMLDKNKFGQLICDLIKKLHEKKLLSENESWNIIENSNKKIEQENDMDWNCIRLSVAEWTIPKKGSNSTWNEWWLNKQRLWIIEIIHEHPLVFRIIVNDLDEINEKTIGVL
jgi:hypothetical protein